MLETSIFEAGHLLAHFRLGIDRDDNLYLGDVLTNAVVRVTPDGEASDVLDATGDGEGNTLARPHGLAFDRDRNVFVTGRNSHNAFKVPTRATCP